MRFTELVSGIVRLNLSEAETGSQPYPYAVYDQTLEYFNAKDGCYKVASSLRCQIISNDFDQADAIRAQIEAAVVAGMNNSQFSCALSTVNKDCTEGVWDIEMNFRINQYR